MAKILTGIQSTGTPHLGNILGAIIPAVDMANSTNDESYLFIANMHSLTQIKDEKILKENTFSTAATWLAFGLDPEKTCFYRQSDVPQTTELNWYLNCFFPYSRLMLAHSFKDKADRLEDVNAGLFTYPMLMAADILLYDAELVPVGKAYSGYTNDELKSLDRWVRNNTVERFGPVRSLKPGLVVEVSFDNINYSSRHKSGVALRFPRFTKIRWDKPISQVCSLKYIKDLIN